MKNPQHKLESVTKSSYMHLEIISLVLEITIKPQAPASLLCRLSQWPARKKKLTICTDSLTDNVALKCQGSSIYRP